MKHRVLVVGVYLADRENSVEHLMASFAGAKNVDVDQRWGCVFGQPSTDLQRAYTSVVSPLAVSKFEMVNRLIAIAPIVDYDYIIVSDDDIELPAAFVERFIGLQEYCGFGLAQPARTTDSEYSHRITLQVEGIRARQTRFVEIGPLFSMHASVFGYLLPFDEEAPMGWGLDYIWPILSRQNGFKMGVIDEVPVRHALRKPYLNYGLEKYRKLMCKYLEQHEHLSSEEAFEIIKIYE